MTKRELKKELKQVIRGTRAELCGLERKNPQHFHDATNGEAFDSNINVLFLALMTAEKALAYLEK